MEYTRDVLYRLWKIYEAAGKKGVFLSYWVSMILGPGQGDAYTMDDLETIAANRFSRRMPISGALTLGEGWVQWLLPHSWVHLQGFDFGSSRVVGYDIFPYLVLRRRRDVAPCLCL